MEENEKNNLDVTAELELTKILENKVFIDRYLKEHLSTPLISDVINLIELNTYLNSIRFLLSVVDEDSYPKVEDLLFNDAQNKVSLKDDKIKKVVNSLIDAGMVILNNVAVCNNQDSLLKDCFEDYRKMFNKVKEYIN